MLIVFIGMGIAPQNKRIKMQSWGSDEKHDGGYNIFQGESALIAYKLNNNGHKWERVDGLLRPTLNL